MVYFCIELCMNLENATIKLVFANLFANKRTDTVLFVNKYFLYFHEF